MGWSTHIFRKTSMFTRSLIDAANAESALDPTFQQSLAAYQS